MGVFITPFGICPLAAEKGIFALPVDRARSREQLLSGRSTARLTELETESRALCPVDRRLFREQSSLAVDRLGRPASPAWLRAHSVHVGRSARSTAHCYGRPAVSQSDISGTEKLGFLT